MTDTPEQPAEAVTRPVTHKIEVEAITSHRNRCFELAAQETLDDGKAAYRK